MFNLEELQKQFINAYCAWTLFCNTEVMIEKLIEGKLPKHIRNKIGSIGFDTEFEDYMILQVRVASKDNKEVFTSLKTVYPSLNWEIHDMGHFSNIDLILNDDVISSLPLYLYEPTV